MGCKIQNDSILNPAEVEKKESTHDHLRGKINNPVCESNAYTFLVSLFTNIRHDPVFRPAN